MQAPPRLYVKTDTGEVKAYHSDMVDGPKLWSPDVTLVPRADCAFRRLKLAEASVQGYAALRLQALSEARDGHDHVYIRPGQSGRWANVWTFSAPSSLRGQAIPETELQQAGEDGLRLAETLSGIEGQFWQTGELLASRWWPSHPKPHQWTSFLQGLDQAALGGAPPSLTSQVPAISPVPLSRKLPLVTAETFRTGSLSPKALLKPSRIFLAVTMISLLFSAYLGAQFVHANMNLSAKRTEIDALSARTQTIMADRRAALENLSTTQQFDALGSRTLLLEAWDQLATALSGEPVTFRSFNYNNYEIEIKVDGTFESAAADIVAKIEDLPAFSEVTYTLDRETQSTLKARLSDVAPKGGRAGTGA